MNMRTLIAGILIGAVGMGGAWWFLDTKDNDSELFANKARCAVYTEKRQKEAEEKNKLLDSYSYVEGFYSEVANTCITQTKENALGHYQQMTLIDELTSETLAHAFLTTEEGASVELLAEELKQMDYYNDQLKHYRGDK